MSEFRDLQAKHAALLSRAQADEPVANEVRLYVEEVRRASSQIALPRERDQLRANLRYWAGYIFEAEGTYPNVELAPALGDQPARPWVRPLLAVFFTLLAIGVIYSIARLARGTGVVAATEGVTQSGTALTPLAPTVTTPTVELTDLPLQPTNTTLPTNTPQPAATSTATPSPATPTPEVFALELIAPADGQSVGPEVALNISYENLMPGHSIHVLLQSGLASGRVTPVQDYLLIPAGATTGVWSPTVRLGEGAELEQPQDYRMRLVVATTDAARDFLEQAAQTGLDDFEQLPDGFLSLPQTTITLTRGAFREIKDIRLFYRRDLDDNYEFFIDSLEGGAAEQLTATQALLEWSGCLSPDGQQIAFAGQEIGPGGSLIAGIWRMGSNGQNPVVLVQEPGATYERPAWSPDGRYVAYSAIVPGVTDDGYQLFVFDTPTAASQRLETKLPSSRFPSWKPDSQTLVFSAYPASGGQLGLYEIGLDDNAVAPVKTGIGPDERTQPAVSPDGQRIAFVGYASTPTDSNRDIYVLEVATGEITQATTDSGLDWFPQWAPDGLSIFFESWRTGTFVWRMDPDGGNQRQITHGDPTTRPFVGLVAGYFPIAP